jgi:hypothetical protein
VGAAVATNFHIVIALTAADVIISAAVSISSPMSLRALEGRSNPLIEMEIASSAYGLLAMTGT